MFIANTQIEHCTSSQWFAINQMFLKMYLSGSPKVYKVFDHGTPP